MIDQWPRCEDCGMHYSPPAYYTIEGEHGTSSICPDCAGPHLIPDDFNDPRWDPKIRKIIKQDLLEAQYQRYINT